VACWRARASWRAMVSRPALMLASWAMTLARSRCAAAVEAGSSATTLDSVSAGVLSTVTAVSSTASGGPGGRLSRSRTLASSEKLLRMIDPLVPLLFLPVLDEDIVIAPEQGNGRGQARNVEKPDRRLRR